MKKIALLATLITSFLLITGCTTSCKTPCDTTAPCAHKDLKGEVR